MYTLDMTQFAGGSILRFHSGSNELRSSVIWQGLVYFPMPIEGSGFDISTKGTLPRPRLKVANVNGSLSALVMQYSDLVGCKLTRKRTFARYLDAVNFTSGVNVNADPNQHLPDDLWYVEQKMTENKYQIEWELSSVFDLQGVQLPSRQVIQNSCSWQYKSAECGYTGTNYFDLLDVATTQSLDLCGKRLDSCKARFGPAAILPYGGFPGAVRYG